MVSKKQNFYKLYNPKLTRCFYADSLDNINESREQKTKNIINLLTDICKKKRLFSDRAKFNNL